MFSLKLTMDLEQVKVGDTMDRGTLRKKCFEKNLLHTDYFGGAQHFLHDSVYGTGDGQILPIEELNKTHSVMP